MPSIRSAMPTVVQAKPAGPRKERVVGFVKGEVTGISRPANIAESWALYDFEMHARACPACRNPYDVHRSGRQLCDEGHRLAQLVAQFLYMKRDGEAYSTDEEGERHSVVRVEIQPTYEEARGLLRAIERGIRHRRQFVSMDRSYLVAPRLPIRPAKHQPAVHMEQTPALPPRHPGHAEQYDSPRQAVINVAKRGSLYEADMLEQHRNYAKYNIEVREPSHRDMREHRHSGYYR